MGSTKFLRLSPTKGKITLKSSAYYQPFYLNQGRSGILRDATGYEVLQRDVLATQREFAHRLYTATDEEED